MSTNAIRPQKGDILWANRVVKGGPYFHCGVYAGAGKVIHFAAPRGAEISAENAVIHETDYDTFADGCPVKIVEYPEGFPPEEVVRRAKSRLGERGYDLAANNCEHFASWCKTGKHRSHQVDEVKNVIKSIGGEAGELICAVQEIVQDFKAPLLDDTTEAKAIAEKLALNSDMADTTPQDTGDAADTELPPEARIIGDDEAREIEITERPPEEPDKTETPSKVSNNAGEAEGKEAEEAPEKKPPENKDEDEPEEPPAKPLVIDRIAGGLKKATVVVAGALIAVQKKLPAPFSLLPIPLIARKVCVVIDKAAVYIKRFFGKITEEQAREELANINAAELGETVAQKQAPGLPVKEAVKTVFGKVGAAVKQLVHKAVRAIVPAPVRAAIKTGWQIVTGVVAKGIQKVVTVAKKIGQAILHPFKALAGLFFGK